VVVFDDDGRVYSLVPVVVILMGLWLRLQEQEETKLNITFIDCSNESIVPLFDRLRAIICFTLRFDSCSEPSLEAMTTSDALLSTSKSFTLSKLEIASAVIYS